MNWTILKDFQIQKSQVVFLCQKKSALVLYQCQQWFFFFRSWKFHSWHSLLIVNKTMRRIFRRVQKMQQKKMHSRKLHRTIVERCLQPLLPVSASTCTQSNWRGKGWKRTYSLDMGMDAKRLLFYRMKRLIFVIFPKMLPISHFFSHFHENCLLRTWRQCKIGDSLLQKTVEKTWVRKYILLFKMKMMCNLELEVTLQQQFLFK